MNYCIKTIITCLALLLPIGAIAQLSEEEKLILAQKVRTNYELSGIDGTQIYQTPNHWTLVTLVSVSPDQKAAQQSRQAQVKATRAAVEFLKGTVNSSVTVYDAFSNDETSMTENQGTSTSMDNQTIGSKTTSSVNEQTVKSEKETMSDKIVQSAIDKIDGMQALIKFEDKEEGVNLFAYYIVITKHKAKKKR